MATATVTPPITSQTTPPMATQKPAKGGLDSSSSIAPLVGKQSPSWRLPKPLVPKLEEITHLSISTPAGLERVVDVAIKKISNNPARYYKCLPIRGEHKTGTENFGVRLPPQLTAKISIHRQKIGNVDETAGQLVKRLVCIAVDTPEDPCIITLEERQAERQAEIEICKAKIERFKVLAVDNKPRNAKLWANRLAAQQRLLAKLLSTPL